MNPLQSINFSTGVLTQDALREHFSLLLSYIKQSVSVLSDYGFGVVDTKNPSVRTESEQKPLWFEAVDKTHYNIHSGMAVTPSGDFAMLSTPITSLILVDLNGGMNLFALQNQLVDSKDYALSVSGQMVPNGQVSVTKLMCITESAYLALDYETRKNTVVIGGVVYDSVNPNKEYFAPTDTRPWLRRWFSMVDIEHRSKLGSGDVTETNPHGIGFSDVKVAGLSIYDQLTSSGMVLSKDSSISGVPGYYCSDAFTSDQIKIDLTGAVTSNSFFGGTNVLYVELQRIPNVICGAYDTSLEVPLSVDHIPGTRIVVLYGLARPESLAVSYTVTPSLEITDVSAGTIGVAGISNKEIVISNGTAVKRLVQSLFPVRRYGSIPRNFRVFIDDAGFLVGDPGILVQSLNIGDNKTRNILAASYTAKTPVFIGIGCHNVGSNSLFTMHISVTGTLADGTESTEILVFNNSTYSDTEMPPAVRENDQQVIFTSKPYVEVTSIEIMDDDEHPFYGVQDSAVLLAYAKLDASKHRYAGVAQGFWNGREAMNIRDARRVLPTVRDGIYGLTAVTSTAEILVGAHEIVSGTAATTQNYKRVTLICAEDFREPRYLDASSVLWEGREILDCPVIPKEIKDSSPYKTCYRSRLLPLRKYDSELCGFIVILNGADSSVMDDGSVRVVMKNDPTFDNAGNMLTKGIAEVVLKPMKDSVDNRVYIGYTSENYRSASFVVSGRCSGFAAYFTNSSDIDIYYSLPVVKR